jgi:hypothetical protein
MIVYSFEELCHALCEILGVAAPALTTSDGTVPAFSFTYKDVSLCLLQAAVDDAAHGVLMIDYGRLPETRQMEVLMSLLEANFMMAGARCPAFSINPISDHVICQMGFAVAQADPMALCQSLESLVAAVHQWRDGHCLTPLFEEPVRPGTPASREYFG